MEQHFESGVIVGQAEVNADDLTRVQAHLRGGRRVWLWPSLLVGFLVLQGVLAPQGFDATRLLVVVLPLLFVAALMAYFVVAGRRAWVKQALANLGGPTTFRFDDFGFSSESAQRQHRLAWAALARATETPDSFLIYTSPQTLLIVPKRAFSADDVTALQSLLPERVTPKPGGATGSLFRRTLLLWVMVLVAFLAIWHFLSLDDAASRQQHEGPDPAELAAGGVTSDHDGDNQR